MGTEFLKIKESEDAKNIINTYFNKYYTSQSEIIDLEDSYNRILFNDIYSRINFPPFDRALKDGFAIKAEDSFRASEEEPHHVKILDALEAGSFSEKVVELGTCVEISTGSPIPKGADAVVMVEFTEKDKDGVNIFTSVTPSQDIGKKGSDIEEGKLLLKKGTLLTSDKIGVLAAQGICEVEVFKKLDVGVISTGNELTERGYELEPAKIYDVNGVMIQNGLISCGARGIFKGIVKDDYDMLKNKILNSLEDCDVLLCSGGTSAGVGDVLKHVLDELGTVIIHGITVQPGKPTILGIVNDKLVIGLPGNPVSAIVIFNVFIAPAIKNLVGMNGETQNKTVKGVLTRRIHSSVGRMQYQLVKLEENEVTPIFKDSGAIFSLASADGYVKVPKSTELLDESEEVEVILFN